MRFLQSVSTSTAFAVCLFFSGTACVALTSPSTESSADWTAAKLEKFQRKMDRAAAKQRWERAGDLAEKALDGCLALRESADPRCLSLMTRCSTYHYRADQHLKYARETELAYRLALDTLGTDHEDTVTLRDVHYHTLLAQQKFAEAIPVLQAILETQASDSEDAYETLELTAQLFGLYHLTGRFEEAEGILKTLLPMVETQIGPKSDDYDAVLRALAENYCLRGKYRELYRFAMDHDLDVRCVAGSDPGGDS